MAFWGPVEAFLVFGASGKNFYTIASSVMVCQSNENFHYINLSLLCDYIFLVCDDCSREHLNLLIVNYITNIRCR